MGKKPKNCKELGFVKPTCLPVLAVDVDPVAGDGDVVVAVEFVEPRNRPCEEERVLTDRALHAERVRGVEDTAASTRQRRRRL